MANDNNTQKPSDTPKAQADAQKAAADQALARMLFIISGMSDAWGKKGGKK